MIVCIALQLADFHRFAFRHLAHANLFAQRVPSADPGAHAAMMFWRKDGPGRPFGLPAAIWRMNSGISIDVGQAVMHGPSWQNSSGLLPLPLHADRAAGAGRKSLLSARRRKAATVGFASCHAVFQRHRILLIGSLFRFSGIVPIRLLRFYRLVKFFLLFGQKYKAKAMLDSMCHPGFLRSASSWKRPGRFPAGALMPGRPPPGFNLKRVDNALAQDNVRIERRFSRCYDGIAFSPES